MPSSGAKLSKHCLGESPRVRDGLAIASQQAALLRKRQGLAELASPGRAPPASFGCRVADDGFEDAPDVFQQDFVARGVGMDEIRQIQFGISGYAI